MSNPAAARDPGVPELPPTMAELPWEDDTPMDSPRHRQQMNLLCETLRLHFHDRPDIYIGADMGVYYSTLQARTRDFRAPDFFVVLDAQPREEERLSWVVWEEERAPSLVIELLSESTEAEDRGRKMTIYARAMHVREYFLYDPQDQRLEGYKLDPDTMAYRAAEPDSRGEYRSDLLDLRLVRAEGRFQGVGGTWLRWARPDGTILRTGEETADAERQRAETERLRADRLAAKLRAAGIEPE